MNDRYRVEHDSLGEVEVPADALWGAQTERSRRNFPIGTQRFPPHFIAAFALVKKACALANAELGNLDAGARGADRRGLRRDHRRTLGRRVSAERVADRQRHADQHEPERGDREPREPARRRRGARAAPERSREPRAVLERRLSRRMHVATVQRCDARLLPALQTLQRALAGRAGAFADLLKTGRTHLMDAAPVTLGQEFGAYAAQLGFCIATIDEARASLLALALGATAVGTGLNAPPGWSARVCAQLAQLSGVPFRPAATCSWRSRRTSRCSNSAPRCDCWPRRC